MFSIPRLPRLGRDRMEQRQERKSKSSSSSRGRRLDRRNAAKNIDYDAVGVSWASTSSDESPGAGLRTRSLDLSPSAYSNQTSFRVEGVEEVDQLCRNLGLSGPEDFAIPTAAWEARKARSSSELLPPSRLLDHSPTASDAQSPPATTTTTAPPKQLSAEVEADNEEIEKVLRLVSSSKDGVQDLRSPSVATGVTGGGQDLGSPRDGGRVKLNGVRPPPVISPRPPIARLCPPKVLSPPSNLVLAPPPSMSRPVLDHQSSIWDLVRSFAPEDDDGGEHKARRSIDSEEDDDDFEKEEEEEEEEQGRHGVEEEVRVGETVADLLGSTSFSTSNDDDSSSTTTETMFVISPNGRFKRNIKSWMRGGLLGSGSFGTVYEGISDDGFFFAVKEVSLVDQGSNAKQCILQLEQEIALLSQFEHENIVQYLGTDKEEVKLYIFIELVTQGSLASLYQKYHLRDSQVSAYTRQILNGLSYLHDRNVVHRDIKCANILVDANGSVKLADFGLAKEITKFNMLKSCKGSVYWMAPEVVNPKRTYGPAADIWSLGCTVLEMLTRQIPYPNLEWTQALFRIGRGEPPPIPNSLSKDARDFIHQCIQVNPDDRPSAAELLEHPFVKRPLPNSAGTNGSSHHRNRS